LSHLDVLSVTKLSPLLEPQLRAAFNLHDRLHETDPAAFAKMAPSIRAIAASGESKVPAALIAQLPALEIISVFGVGYDGVDVAAAKARNVMVTHTPNVLNDDVADLAIGLMLAALLVGLAVTWVLGRWLDGLVLGEHTARSMGLPVDAMRWVLILTLALATGAAVAHTGLIAFVGLAAPHITRRMVRWGARHGAVLAAMLGGLLLAAADLLARLVIAPAELPVGVLTALLGGGYLLWLMRRAHGAGAMQ
jgi:ABC-type Fe3+-siderophore transport system permease subunit